MKFGDLLTELIAVLSLFYSLEKILLQCSNPGINLGYRIRIGGTESLLNIGLQLRQITVLFGKDLIDCLDCNGLKFRFLNSTGVAFNLRVFLLEP